MRRHCADNNAGAQRYLFSGRFQISGDRCTQLLRVIRLREDHSDEKITHHEVGWSPVRNGGARPERGGVCMFITAGPMIKLCQGGRGTVKDMCYEVRRAEACVD